MKKLLTIAGIVLALTACEMKKTETLTCDKNEPAIENHRLTPEVLWAFGNMSGPCVSPDGKRILYGVTYSNVKENKSNRELYVIDADGNNNQRLTRTNTSEHCAQWLNDGKRIAYLSAESGAPQVHILDTKTGKSTQLTDVEDGVEDFRFSPDEKHLLYIATVQNGPTTADIYPDLDKAEGRIVTDLMYRHWDEWVDQIPHPFVAPFDGSKLGEPTDLLEGTLFESPMRPWGGMEQLDFSPDSKFIAYTCRKKTGKEYSLSTDSDIFLYEIETGETVNLCKLDTADQNMGYDINPLFSPDGKYIAWQSMERDGYESDKNRLYVMDLQSREKWDLFANFDQSVEAMIWNKTSDGLFFTSTQHATCQVYQLTDLRNPQIRQITQGVHDYAWIGLLNDGHLAGLRHSMSMPNELYNIDINSGEQTQITFENKHILDQLHMGEVRERWLTTTNGEQMQCWIILPPDFDPNKKYPALLYCQGGPQSPVSQFWSTRWNFQIMAANDYVIIAPNRHGLYGYGQAWLEQISKDYGGQNMRDYFTAIDSLATEPYVDADRLGCVGASYGGFSVYWIAGHHQKRFKAFIAHDGIFNLEQQYVETEEMWFVNWDLGGAYWEKDNAVAQNSYANSPHRFIGEWDTPILCIHGKQDYRIVDSQGMAAFNAAVLRGVPAELLYFPDENHWVSKPQNGVLWQRTFFAWLDKWLK